MCVCVWWWGGVKLPWLLLPAYSDSVCLCWYSSCYFTIHLLLLRLSLYLLTLVVARRHWENEFMLWVPVRDKSSCVSVCLHTCAFACFYVWVIRCHSDIIRSKLLCLWVGVCHILNTNGASEKQLRSPLSRCDGLSDHTDHPAQDRFQ